MIPGESPGDRGTAAYRNHLVIANYIAELKSLRQKILANTLLIAGQIETAGRSGSANGLRPRSAAMSPTCAKCREVVRPAPKGATSRLTSKFANWGGLGTTRHGKRGCT